MRYLGCRWQLSEGQGRCLHKGLVSVPFVPQERLLAQAPARGTPP